MFRSLLFAAAAAAVLAVLTAAQAQQKRYLIGPPPDFKKIEVIEPEELPKPPKTPPGGKYFIVGPAPDFKRIDVTVTETMYQDLLRRSTQSNEYTRKGDDLVRQGRYHDAIACYTSAIQLGVDCEVYAQRARAHRALGDHASAAADHEAYLGGLRRLTLILDAQSKIAASQAEHATRQSAELQRMINQQTAASGAREARQLWENALQSKTGK